MAEVREIALELIDEPQFALRAEISDEGLDELAKDIHDNGLYYPLIVHAKGERFEVRDGHRRLLACRRNGLARVRCIVHSEADPPAEAVKLKTNLLREDNTDAEIAAWLGELATEHNYSLEQLCEMVGRGEEWVNQRIDLLRGDPEVFAALGQRQVNFSQARVLNGCKDASWRKLGLHYAIADHLPARRLKEYFDRNCSQPQAPVQAQAQPANGEPAPVDYGPGIVCACCGGYKDPQNMVTIWVHQWELALFLKAVQQGAQGEA